MAGRVAAETITFDGIPDGTPLLGQTIGTASFTSFLVPLTAATITSINAPDNGTYSEVLVAIGDVSDIVEISFSPAVLDFSYSYVLDDTMMSTAGTRLTAYGVHGITLGELMFVHEQPVDWPSEGKAVGGTASVSGLGGIERVHITFLPALADKFVLDNIRFTPVPEPRLVGIATLVLAISASAICGRSRSRIR